MSGQPEPGRIQWRAVLDPRWLVLVVVGAVAAFCFVVSYSHIFDLGRLHAQAGAAARLLPLSVDLLIVGATLVLFIQSAADGEPDGLARWLPRVTLWAAIGATVAANVAYGLPHGWLSAVISGWPGAAFVAAVEIGVVVVRMPPRNVSETYISAAVPAGQGEVPATAYEAATLGYASSVAGGNPLPARQLMVRYGIKRGEADRIRKPRAPDVPARVASPSQPPALAGTLNGQAS